MKPISTAHSKQFIYQMSALVFPSMQAAAYSLGNNLVVFLNDSLVRF